LLIIAVLPWIRSVFSDPTTYKTWAQLYRSKINLQTVNSIIQAFPRSNSIIKLAQIYFTLYPPPHTEKS
jgi:hypothetical protein